MLFCMPAENVCDQFDPRYNSIASIPSPKKLSSIFKKKNLQKNLFALMVYYYYYYFLHKVMGLEDEML